MALDQPLDVESVLAILCLLLNALVEVTEQVAHLLSRIGDLVWTPIFDAASRKGAPAASVARWASSLSDYELVAPSVSLLFSVAERAGEEGLLSSAPFLQKGFVIAERAVSLSPGAGQILVEDKKLFDEVPFLTL